MIEQPEVFICQHCGRAAADSFEVRSTWLIHPHRNFTDVLIIRCPAHISEWAMRNSSGRTREMRQRALRGRRSPVPPLVGIEPLPTRFRGADRRKEGDGLEET